MTVEAILKEKLALKSRCEMFRGKNLEMGRSGMGLRRECFRRCRRFRNRRRLLKLRFRGF